MSFLEEATRPRLVRCRTEHRDSATPRTDWGDAALAASAQIIQDELAVRIERGQRGSIWMILGLAAILSHDSSSETT